MNGMNSAWVWGYGGDTGGQPTYELNFAPQYTVAQVSLSMADGDGLCDAGIIGYRVRPEGSGAEQRVDFGDDFYNWKNVLYMDHLSSVTFAIALGAHQEGSALCNVFFW